MSSYKKKWAAIWKFGTFRTIEVRHFLQLILFIMSLTQDKKFCILQKFRNLEILSYHTMYSLNVAFSTVLTPRAQSFVLDVEDSQLPKFLITLKKIRLFPQFIFLQCEHDSGKKVSHLIRYLGMLKILKYNMLYPMNIAFLTMLSPGHYSLCVGL